MIKRKKIMISVVIVILSIILTLGVCALYIKYREDKIRFTINDTLIDGQGKKARVILLGGQSNASGCSVDEYLQKNVSPQKYSEYQAGYDNIYINYFVSGNNKSEAFVKCSTLQGETGGFFGPELGMAEKLNEMYPGETFFVIKYAWAGTNLFEQWLSPSSKGKTGQLYKEFTTFVDTSMKYLKSKNYDVKIEGMCWMQGESDSFSVENATKYETHLKNFIKDIRKEFSKYAASDGIAFIDATIADNPVFWVYCDLVNQSKIAVEKLSPINALIDTNFHGLECDKEPADKPDIQHYDSLSQLKLGYLFIEELSQFM